MWKSLIIMTLLVNLHSNLVDGIGCKYCIKVSQRLRLFQVYKQLFQANIGGIPNKSFHMYSSWARACRRKMKNNWFSVTWGFRLGVWKERPFSYCGSEQKMEQLWISLCPLLPAGGLCAEKDGLFRLRLVLSDWAPLNSECSQQCKLINYKWQLWVLLAFKVWSRTLTWKKV